jgi:bile acid:Na+ symporter, BASS family
MRELLTQSLGMVVALFVFVAMFNLGLDLTIKQIVEPLRNRRLFFSSMVANVILIPVLTFAFAGAMPLEEATRIGLLLYVCCAGSEAGPKLVQIAGGNAAFAVALLGALLPVTVFAIPLALFLALPDVQIEQGKLLLKLLLVVVLPMSIGLSIKATRGAAAARLSAVVHRISVLLLGMAFAQIIYVNYEKFAALQSIVLFAGLLFFVLAFAVGYLVGGPGKQSRKTLGIMSLMRGGSVSMVIAGQAFPHEPKVLVMATVMTSLSVVVGVLVTVWLRRLSPVTAG